jgi:hypothetical protein
MNRSSIMSQHVVVIGAVALGPKAACRFKRLEPDSRLPWWIRSDLISTGVVEFPILYPVTSVMRASFSRPVSYGS